MAKQKTYYDYLREEMSELVDQLQLPGLQKQSLKRRWLDQVVWADKKAEQCRRWHYRLRLTTIVGGITLPALVGINLQLAKDNPSFRTWFPYVPFALSQVIAVSAAAEEFFRYGDRWREYRKMSEDLKAEGWQYLQLTGPYQPQEQVSVLTDQIQAYRQKLASLDLAAWQPTPPEITPLTPTTHKNTYALFAGRIESIIQNDVQSYITAMQQQQVKENQQVQQLLGAANSVATDKTLFAQPTSLPPLSAPDPHPPAHGNRTVPPSFPNGTAKPSSLTAPTAPAAFVNATPMPPQPAAPTVVAQPAAIDLNEAILAAATELRGMSTADGPDGGRNACAWTVNKVLHKAGIEPLSDYVPDVIKALQKGRGQRVSREAAKAGDLVIAAGDEHIGIGITDGCTHVLSNSSSHACFQWESNTDFDGYYRGSSIIYRLIR